MITWNNTKIDSIFIGKVGAWELFTVYKNGKNIFYLKCNLPGLKPVQGAFKDAEEAKGQAEFLLSYWLERGKFI